MAPGSIVLAVEVVVCYVLEEFFCVSLFSMLCSALCTMIVHDIVCRTQSVSDSHFPRKDAELP